MGRERPDRGAEGGRRRGQGVRLVLGDHLARRDRGRRLVLRRGRFHRGPALLAGDPHAGAGGDRCRHRHLGHHDDQVRRPVRGALRRRHQRRLRVRRQRLAASPAQRHELRHERHALRRDPDDVLREHADRRLLCDARSWRAGRPRVPGRAVGRHLRRRIPRAAGSRRGRRNWPARLERCGKRCDRDARPCAARPGGDPHLHGRSQPRGGLRDRDLRRVHGRRCGNGRCPHRNGAEPGAGDHPAVRDRTAPRRR